MLSRLVSGDDAGLAAREGASVSRDEMASAGLSGREITELVEKLEAPGHPDFDLDLSTMRTADEMASEMFEAVPSSFE